MSSRTSHKNRVSSRIASIIWGITSILTIGVILWFALSPTKDIPDDWGTLGGALKAMMGINWETVSSVLNTSQLGGIAANYYIQWTPSDKICTNSSLVTTLGAKGGSGLIKQIKSDGSLVCADQIANGSTILRPILATIRDLDSSCYGQVTVTNASGSTYSPNNSDPVDIYESDTITTTPLCAMASLYFIDHSIVRLAPSTVLALRSAWTAGGSGSTDVTLSEGELWARVFKPITDDSYFNVSTDESSVGVRGTSLYVKRNKATKETTTFAMDSGLPVEPITAGTVAAKLYPKGASYATDLRLAQVVVTKSTSSDIASITTNNVSTGSTVYNDPKLIFVRIATLTDLADFDALKVGVGNLPTIAMTGSWLKTNDIWSGAIAQSARNGIIYNTADPTDKIVLEVARTEPAGSLESTRICATEWTPFVWLALAGGDSTNNSNAYITVERNNEILESSDCFDSTIIAGIERHRQHTGDYKIKGLKVKNIGFRAKGTNEWLKIGDLAANNGTINAATSSWKISMTATVIPNGSKQHLINIGSGTDYIRVYLSGSALMFLTWAISSAPKFDLTWVSKITITLKKVGTQYTMNVLDGDGSSLTTQNPGTAFPITFSNPIQTLFVGKINDVLSWTNYLLWDWEISNIQILRN